MPAISNMELHMSLVADLERKAQQYLDTSNDMKRKAQNMLAYAQAHCEHEFTPPLPAHAHEGGVCKHCKVGELFAVQHRKQWLAMEANGNAPWGPRAPAATQATTKATLLSNDTTEFKREAK